jgi:pimeloyl-ACP methyl ester carboxylesterase
MKPVLLLIIFGAFSVSFQAAPAQETNQPVFVIVHGAWGGGWAYQKVDSLLTAAGAVVYRPTLTGQGERVHLASTAIGLDTHILDVVNTILYEGLQDVVLVGHSYGGMVVTGVADSVPGRIRHLVYIDAFLPENGESLLSIIEATGGNSMQAVNGFVIPPWVPPGQAPPSDVPHPYKTWSDTLYLNNPDRPGLPTTYILTVDKGKDPAEDAFTTQAERAGKHGWPILYLEADHNAQWSAPEKFAEMLLEIEGR